MIEKYSQQENTVPIIAIGGIKVNDIEELRKIGLSGVAISSLLTHSKDPKNEIQQILDRFAVRV